ncbi:PDZ domain-containing protein 9-like [Hypanus sabinus]|uniref:PDZ domain-containing protein 9-like n=1 Tax=Hypanus sabinus TaxID=79690 RepID=UPI0028C48E7B|nr:PDZ domain-containing protein 9-like [Hypanus sabinus]
MGDEEIVDKLFKLLCFADPVTDVKENPDHNLGSSYKTFIKRGAKGLGLVLIKNGSFLQILRVIESGPGDSETNLKPGDILVKIGNTNVLGYKLRELRQLVGKIPIGTQLQVVVYRNYKEIPDNWKSEAGADSSEEGESGLSSSSDNNDGGNDQTFRVRFNNFRPLSLFWHNPGISIPPVSRMWHSSEKNRSVLLIGSHIGCDIMLHREFEDSHEEEDSKEEATSPHVLGSDAMSSTSSSSSSADLQWIKQFQTSDLALVPATTQCEKTVDEPAPAVPSTAETPPGKEKEQSGCSTDSPTSSGRESSLLYPQSSFSNTSTQFVGRNSTITSSKDFTGDSSRLDMTLKGDLRVPEGSPAECCTEPQNSQQKTSPAACRTRDQFKAALFYKKNYM